MLISTIYYCVDYKHFIVKHYYMVNKGLIKYICKSDGWNYQHHPAAIVFHFRPDFPVSFRTMNA